MRDEIKEIALPDMARLNANVNVNKVTLHYLIVSDAKGKTITWLTEKLSAHANWLEISGYEVTDLVKKLENTNAQTLKTLLDKAKADNLEKQQVFHPWHKIEMVKTVQLNSNK
jgi:hypothetical protein